jgi:hypothetical protein
MTSRQLTSILMALSLSGCFGNGEKEATREETPEARARRFEAQFTPSAEDRVAASRREGSSAPVRHTGGDSAAPAPTPQPTEEVSGFRIQLFSTTDIDEAAVKKGEAELLFPGEWVYMQYDQPSYKIRVGNFIRRFDAERFRTLAVEKGFSSAWIVPSHVLKNPPPPPPHPVQTEPPTE